MPLQLKLWSEAEFADSRAAWQALHAESRADPLFLSWDWQWRWWRHHKEALRATLLLVAGYRDHQLVGLAPLYSHRATFRGALMFRRIEVNGLAWRHPVGFFSEYLDLVVLPEHETGFVEALGDWLEGQPGWDDLALPITRRDSPLSKLADGMAERGHWHRETDTLEAHRIELPANWPEYVGRLSSSARRRIVNHRQKAESPTVVSVAPPEVSAFLDTLDSLRGKRWGRGSPLERSFLEDCSRAMVAAGEARLSRLEVQGEMLSCLYTIRRGDAEYFLLSAFREKPGVGLSPGYLHLGYAIEASIQAGCKTFDLLAGSGRHRDYKTDFGTVTTPLVCHQVVRAGWLKLLHRMGARLRA